MASGNKKISDLIAAGSATNSDLFEIEQAGVSKKLTAAQLSTLLVGGKTNLVWYDDTVDNLMGGTALDTNIDKDIFAGHTTGVDNYQVIIRVELDVEAIDNEGDEYYTAKWMFSFRRSVGIGYEKLGQGVAPYEIATDGFAVDMSISDNNVRLTLTTPSNAIVAWRVVATISYARKLYIV